MYSNYLPFTGCLLFGHKNQPDYMISSLPQAKTKSKAFPLKNRTITTVSIDSPINLITSESSSFILSQRGLYIAS
jgi:hypothetical protein